MIRRPPRSTRVRSSAASDVYKRQGVWEGQGTAAYLHHVAREHRGQALGDVVLYKLGCVDDRACADDEDFDINLLPYTGGNDTTGGAMLALEKLVPIPEPADQPW